MKIKRDLNSKHDCIDESSLLEGQTNFFQMQKILSSIDVCLALAGISGTLVWSSRTLFYAQFPHFFVTRPFKVVPWVAFGDFSIRHTHSLTSMFQFVSFICLTYVTPDLGNWSVLGRTTRSRLCVKDYPSFCMRLWGYKDKGTSPLKMTHGKKP